MPRRRRMPNRAGAPRRQPYPVPAASARPSLGRVPLPREAVDRRVGLAMLPLRAFLGFTFVFAGLDKLLFDPTFLDPHAPTSILAQLQGFDRTSPLAPLIAAIGEPLAIPIGILIAFSEIAVGLGVLSGLLLRLSAWGGAAIATLLWLTASWSIHPFYLGPDLPYIFAFTTLALVGDGNVLTLRGAVGRWAWGSGLLDEVPAVDVTAEPLTGSLATPSALDLSRRRFLEGLFVGVAALFVGGVTGWLGIGGREAAAAARLAATPSTTPPGSGASPPTPTSSVAAASGPPASASAGVVGDLASVKRTGSEVFTVPTSGDPGVLVALADGSVVAFDAVCTHAGCTVEYDPSQLVLACPCHGAVFDATAHGAVLAGPTDIPLVELPISIDQKTGRISLTA